MVSNCKRLSITFFVLCLFSSLAYCQDCMFSIDYKNENVKKLGNVTMILNRQLLAPTSSMARLSIGGTNWNNTEQLLNEAEAIILELQKDRNEWQQRALFLKGLNEELEAARSRDKTIRRWLIGILAVSVTTSVVVIAVNAQ